MNKKLLYFLLPVFFALFIESCRKYPEGPLVSFRTKMARITGVWDIVNYEVNGIDSVNQFKMIYCNGLYHFFKDKTSSDSYSLHFENKNFDSCHTSFAEWSFGKRAYSFFHVEALTLGVVGLPIKQSISENLKYGLNGDWDILRLTNKELWLKKNYINQPTSLIEVKLYKISE